MICEKPNYEVGSSAKLSFAKPATKSAVASVWKIDNDDDEIINPDDLLDEEDKIKPDPSTLRGNFYTQRRGIQSFTIFFLSTIQQFVVQRVNERRAKIVRAV